LLKRILQQFSKYVAEQFKGPHPIYHEDCKVNARGSCDFISKTRKELVDMSTEDFLAPVTGMETVGNASDYYVKKYMELGIPEKRLLKNIVEREVAAARVERDMMAAEDKRI
jgi:hypothetical protein